VDKKQFTAEPTHPSTLAGDPFAFAGSRHQDPPCACLEGWVFITYEDEHGEEREASYRCRRCNAGEEV
jgi:hypothetical protein